MTKWEPWSVHLTKCSLASSSEMPRFRKPMTNWKARVEARTADLVRAKDDAEVASRAKSEFLANMSHEFARRLNGVIGMTDLALNTELTSEQKEYLETVKFSADSLLAVINDVLDFSKIEAGKVELEAIDFNLRDSLEVTLKTLALRAMRRASSCSARSRRRCRRP